MSRGCRFISCCLPLGILCLSGCLIPYAYPNLSFVPGGDPGREMPDCHVFRVDASAYQEDIGENDLEYSVAEIARLHDGSFPPQFGITVNRGFYVVGVALNFNVGWVHSTKVRLYRPGYKLIELAPWETIDNIEWQTATNVLDQERAVDAILRQPTVTSWGETKAASSQKEKGVVDQHGLGDITRGMIYNIQNKETELFAAKEYERVAALATIPADITRLRKKAEELRAPILTASEITATGTAPPPASTPKSP